MIKKKRLKINRIILDKITKYLSKLTNKILVPINKIKTIHQNLIQVDLDNEGNNPYQLFLGWLLDVVEFGVLTTLVYTVFIGIDSIWEFTLYSVGFGVLRYVFIELLRNIKEATGKK